MSTQPISTNIAVVPLWDPRRKRQATKYLFGLALGVLLAAWLATLYWLFGPATVQDAPPTLSLTGLDLWPWYWRPCWLLQQASSGFWKRLLESSSNTG